MRWFGGARPTSLFNLEQLFLITSSKTYESVTNNSISRSTSPKMINAILLVFLLQLAIHIINTVGKQTINDLVHPPSYPPNPNAATNKTIQAWLLYTKLPTAHSAEASSISELRREVVRLNRELTATSAQDEFAKWAKLRRQHDKAKAEYDSQSRSLQNFHGTFNTAITILRFLATQGLQFGANFYYSKEAMFWLPRGWVPWHVEWLLSFPRAPVGGVSINVWALCCAGVIGLVFEGVTAVWSLRSGVAKEGERKGEAIKMEGLSSKSAKTSSREKKEL